MAKSYSLRKKKRSTKNKYGKKPHEIRKTMYFYRHKDGSFKPIYAHKYMKDFGVTGRKSYNIHRKSANYKDKPYYGKFYKQRELNKNISQKTIKRRSVRREKHYI